MNHPDALSQSDARRWPARHGCPVGRFRHLEVIHTGNVLDDAVAGVVPPRRSAPKSVVMQLLSIQGPLPFASKTQRDGHLDLVTATLARPDMMDFVVAHVCRRLWRDQYVIAFAARHPRARASVHPRGHGVET
jgi:hypothetical protein